VQATTVRPQITVTAGGQGVASHAGTRLLGDLADAAGMSAAFCDALAGLRERRSCHDPGRVLVDLAVMLADGGEAISDLAVLRDQPGLFGSVASTATAWRVLDGVDEQALDRLREGRAAARERAWLLRAEAGPGHPGGDRWRPGLARSGARCGRHPGRGSQRKAGCGGALQGRVRLPSHPGVVGQHQRGAGRPAASG